MSISMSNVKAVTLNGHSVKKIADTNGNVLWENKNISTINLTVGSQQDMAITQYAEGIVLPSLNDIKNKISSKTGISSSNITIKYVKIQDNTLYWRVGSNYNNGTTYYGLFSSEASVASTSEPISQSEAHIYPWNSSPTSYTDITYYLYTSSSRTFYGYIGTSSEEVGTPFVTSRYNNKEAHFCKSSNAYGLPTFTLVVTYEVK